MSDATLSNLSPSQAQQWKDPYRYLWTFGVFLPAIPFVYSAIVWGTGATWIYTMGVPLLFLITIILDNIGPVNNNNPPDSAISDLDNDKYYRVLTYLFLPVQYAGYFWCCWLDTTQFKAWSPEWIGLAFMAGAASGVGINCAHELGHKTNSFERMLARLILAPTGYGHFTTEHNRGHHVRVATFEDPATGRLGESVWSFMPRSVIGSAKSAWELEKVRLARLGKSPWSRENDVLMSWMVSVVFFAVVIGIFGLSMIPFVLIAGVYGFSLLEAINYLEHYGLMRRRMENGRYERCAPEHSWNSNTTVGNILLYHLQRHSDHHAYPLRRYQCLRNFENVPTLPFGYPTMVILTYIPPLFHYFMDKRVVKFYNGDLSRANIQPSARERIYKRFGYTPGANVAAE